MPANDLNTQQYAGSLVSGGSIVLDALDYFALIEGSGLQIAARGRGRACDLPLYMLFGDGLGRLGGVVLSNPTGSTVAYKLITASRRFDPTALAAQLNVNAVATGAAANGAAVSGNPVLVAGSDGTNARTIATTTGGVARVANEAVATGGATRHRVRSAATTNSTNVKGSAGKVCGIIISNTNAAARYLKLYDKATAPVIGTDTPAATILVRAGETYVYADSSGIAFTLGIGYGMTTGEADTDVAAVAAGDLHLCLAYA